MPHLVYVMVQLKTYFLLISILQGLPAFTEALSRFYSPLYGRQIEPTKEISVHSGGTEAILSVITALVEPGDEIILMQPGFDLYVISEQLGSNKSVLIQPARYEFHSKFVGAALKYVHLHPPSHTGSSNADEWRLDMDALEAAMSSKSKLLVSDASYCSI